MSSDGTDNPQPTSAADAQFDEQDRVAMVRLAAGHDAALNELMARHAGKLFHYLLRCLQDEEDAADLAQETFMRVYQHRANFDPGRKFSAWLYTVATNLVKDRYRHRARHPQVSLDAENTATGNEFRDSLPASQPTPGEACQTADRVEAVRKAVAQLPEDLRLPLVLAEWEGKPVAEAALILRLTPKAVETRLYRARQLLRERLVRWLKE